MLGRNYRHVVALLCLATATVASAQTMPDTVAAAFARMQHLCRSDGGKTWGVELCGPVLFADPATRRFWADHDGLQQALTQHGDIFTGQLPATVPIANTAVEWNGRSWTMLMLPLPEQEPALSILLMHEAWHRIQQQIGLAAGNAEQPQLETEAGRLALRLELRALASAFAASDAPARRQAIADALLFRAWRQQRWPDAEAAEDTMERHEGLAEYTGRLLAQDPAMIAHLRQHLGRGDAVDAYARSFAYYTGPAYAFLLDAAQPRWRADWNRCDGLPAMLARQLALVTAADDAAFAARGAHYRLGEVQAEERLRAQQHAVRVAALRARLIDGPTLQAPVRGASFSFDPNRVTLLPQGTVYAVIRAAGEWGVLEVDGDGLLAMDWSRLSVSHAGVTATADGFKGEGWTLVLQPGWALVAGARAGDWTIRRAD